MRTHNTATSLHSGCIIKGELCFLRITSKSKSEQCRNCDNTCFFKKSLYAGLIRIEPLQNALINYFLSNALRDCTKL